MGAVVAHHEYFSVWLGGVRVCDFILEAHSGAGECDVLAIRGQPGLVGATVVDLGGGHDPTRGDYAWVRVGEVNRQNLPV